MKLSATIITLLAGSAAAFAPAMPSAAVRSSSSSQQQTVMFAEPKEEEGLDLDLGEMFDMYVTCRHYHYLSNALYVVPFVWKDA